VTDTRWRVKEEGAARGGSRFPDDRDHHRARAAADVAFQVKNLLPGSEHQLAFGNGHGQRRAEQSGLQVRMAVAVVPGLLVAIVAAGRNELVEDGRQVALQPRLKFNGADGRRAGAALKVRCWPKIRSFAFSPPTHLSMAS